MISDTTIASFPATCVYLTKIRCQVCYKGTEEEVEDNSVQMTLQHRDH